MSDYLKIRKNGIFEYNWNSEKRKYVGKKVQRKNILRKLRVKCKITKGTTLGDLFNIVDYYSDLKNLISNYSWCRQIDEFHAQAKEPILPEENEDEKMEYLEIFHCDDLFDYKGKREVSSEVGFHGVGTNKGGKCLFSVSHSPMYELVNYEIRLNEKLEIVEPFKSGVHNKKNLPKKLLEGVKAFSLLEILDAIYWDISFVGGPEENKEFVESLKDRFEEMKNIPLIPMEQVTKRIEGKDFVEETEEEGMKVLLHPDVARFFGVNPDDIPLDDKHLPKRE